jgi:NAD(P)-dependent dehydrogenase (short-subunit alcohol dehydrogenase family)
MDLHGKVALVTGGSSGIGRAAAIASRGRERDEAAAAEIVARGGSTLFVAAAVEEPFAPTADVTEEQFDRAIAVNLKSVWLCSNAASFLTGHSLIVDGGLTSLYR